MPQHLVVTFTGPDRPGIVDALADLVQRHGANWERSRMATLAGRFAGVLEVTADPERAAALAGALEGVEDLTVRVDRGSSGPAPDSLLRLELTGQDRPGIVHEVTRILAARAVSIHELETETVETPVGGGMLFRATAELSAPANVSRETLQAALEEIAHDLMVEIELTEPPSPQAQPA